jgi:amidase
MPAAWCGVVGLKPSRGRILEDPAADPSPYFMNVGVDFGLTRSVRDAAALLDVMQGSVVGELYRLSPPRRSYRDEIRTAPAGLKVALTTTGWSPHAVNGEHQDAVAAVGRTLEEDGHCVVEASPPFNYEATLDAYVRLSAIYLAYTVDTLSAATGLEPKAGVVEATILNYARMGRELRGLDACAAHGVFGTARRSIGQWFEDYDVLVTPTMTEAPCRLGTLDANDSALDPYAWQRRSFTYAPFTWPFNVTGQPAISLPLCSTSAGLPIGVQVVGRLGDDATVLKIAAQLEDRMPWANRMPAVVAGGGRATYTGMS